jgi:hypothetical protein
MNKGKKKIIVFLIIFIFIFLFIVSLLIFIPKNNNKNDVDAENIIKSYLNDQNLTFKVVNENDNEYDIIVESSDSQKSGEFIIIKDTKEVLLLNHHKYNWTSSEKFRKPLEKEINSVKNEGFKAYLLDLFNGIDTVSIPYQYSNDTTVSVSDTVTDTVSVSDTEKEKKKKKKNEYEEPKESYGELGNVKLTIKEYDRLLNDYGYELTHKAIDYLDGYIADKKYKSADNNRALRRWVFDAVKEQEQKRAKLNGQQKQSNFDAVAERFLARGEEDAKEGNFRNFEGAM